MDLLKYMAKPEKTIEEHNNDLIERLDKLKEFNYISERNYNLTKIACKYHDVGKVNKEFQKRVTSEKKIKFDENKEIVHNILSLYFINEKSFEDKKDYYIIANAVLYHHNYGDVGNILINEEKKKLAKKLLEDFKEEIYLKKNRKVLSEINNLSSNEDETAILVKGFLHKCDYAASAGFEIEYSNNYLINLLEKWKNEKNIKLNELQKFCIDNRDNNIIAIAQTGMGKTEAGLYWIGNNKGFFILPLKVAINAIYDRIRNMLKNNNIDDKDLDKKLAILHSETLEYYSKNQIESESGNIIYNKRGKNLSMPLTISTIDQIFDFVFKYNGYELKLATLSYSKVVIDEIQMYNADLLAYLIYGLERIVEIGGKIAIVTATLPPFISDLLKKKIEFKQGEFVSDLKRHNVKVKSGDINSKDIIEKYKYNKLNKKNNKILVICNSVKETQRLYSEIKNELNENVYLLHSKYTKQDRSRLEKEILDFAETKSVLDNEIKNGIWISTSIVEASLDIDFDYLFTELKDLNSLFQRLGRCNRKGLKCVEETNCFIYVSDENKKEYKSLFKNGVMDKEMYKLSKKALLDDETLKFDGIVSEQLKIDLLNKYFTTDKLKNSEFMEKYSKTYNYIIDKKVGEDDKKDEKLRNIYSKNIIPYNIYLKNEKEICDNVYILENNDLELEEKINLLEEINKYTVSIQLYEYSRANLVENKKIKLNKCGIIIEVMDCHYDDMGFVRLSKEELNKSEFI